MKAIVLEGSKGPLVLKEVSIPDLQEHEALVRVKAAAFNRRDWWIQQGLYAGLKFPIILGSDGAGVVEKVGNNRHAGWVGRHVIIDAAISWGGSEAVQGSSFHILGLPQDGTFAEYVRVPVANLYDKPSHLSFEEAAALPLGGLTAYRALFSKANLQSGERVLIIGAGGGVATFALLWAIHAQAQVYVTSSSKEKIAQSIALGAKGGVLYSEENWVQQLQQMGQGFDVIVDSALGEGFVNHLDLANAGGRIVFFGGTVGNIPALNARKIFWKQLSILGTTMGSPADFSKMLEFVNKHKIKPVIDSVHPFDEAEQALRKMDRSVQFGKLVLRMG